MPSFNSLAELINSDFADFSRAAAGYYLKGDGLFSVFEAGVPRIDASKGLLIEPAATNLALHSAAYSQAVWGKTTVGAVIGQADPAGGSTAYRLTESGASAAMAQITVPVTAGQTYTASRIIKRGNTDLIRVTLGGPGFTNASYTWWNLATGAALSVSSGGTGWGYVSRSITAIGGGYFVITVTFTVPAAETNMGISIATANANNTTTRADIGSGPGIGGYYDMWVTQIELGTTMSTPILSGASAATRPTDALTLFAGTGTYDITATFDDDTTQALAGVAIAGAGWAVPANLNRRYLKNLSAVAA